MLLRKEEKKRGGMIVIWRDDFDKAILRMPITVDQVSSDNIWFWIKDFLESGHGLDTVIEDHVNVLAFNAATP